MRDHQMFSRIHNAVRSVETGTPFARGRFEGRETFSSAPRNHERILVAHNTVPEDAVRNMTRMRVDTAPFVEAMDAMRGERAESTERAIRNKWLGLESATKTRGDGKGEKVARMIRRSLQNDRNGGRKPRTSSRETIRNMRTLSHEEQLLAGDALREENKARKARRDARACKRTIVARLPSPEFNLGTERKAA